MLICSVLHKQRKLKIQETFLILDFRKHFSSKTLSKLTYMLLKLQLILNTKFASEALHSTVCVKQDYTTGLPYAAVKKQNTSTLMLFQPSFCINLQGKQKQSTSKGQATLLSLLFENSPSHSSTHSYSPSGTVQNPPTMFYFIHLILF